MEVQIAQAVAEIVERHASANHKQAQAAHLDTETALAPVRLAHEAHQANEDRDQRAEQARESRTGKATRPILGPRVEHRALAQRLRVSGAT
jgi:hypothetical protein